MPLEYWWAKRNNRRAASLPDLNAPLPELPGTPETRCAACFVHVNRSFETAKIRAERKRAWLAAQRRS